MKNESLLQKLFDIRLKCDLTKALQDDKEYQLASNHLEKKINKVEKIKLSRKQWKAIDKALSASNHCCTEYGRVAYHQGFLDAIKLISELSELPEL